MENALVPSRRKEEVGAELDDLRNQLAKALRSQPTLGAVERQYLTGITADDCTRAISLEWKWRSGSTCGPACRCARWNG